VINDCVMQQSTTAKNSEPVTLQASFAAHEFLWTKLQFGANSSVSSSVGIHVFRTKRPSLLLQSIRCRSWRWPAGLRAWPIYAWCITGSTCSGQFNLVHFMCCERDVHAADIAEWKYLVRSVGVSSVNWVRDGFQMNAVVGGEESGQTTSRHAKAKYLCASRRPYPQCNERWWSAGLAKFVKIAWLQL